MTFRHYEATLASKKTATSDPLAYSIDAAVRVSGQSRTGLYLAIKSGELVARKRKSRTVILADDLRAWLEGLPRLKTRPAT